MLKIENVTERGGNVANSGCMRQNSGPKKVTSATIVKTRRGPTTVLQSWCHTLNCTLDAKV
ncbi:hypothetical protein J6590_037741 [Homalodisca vitripennis]|nr:hypothetical protein J6590_037741 [Homalodisca vitripennis]